MAAIVIAGGVATTALVSRIMYDQLDRELAARGRVMAGALKELATHYVLAGDVLQTADTIKRRAQDDPEIEYIYVVDFDGGIFAHSFAGGFPSGLADLEKAAGRGGLLGGVELQTNSGIIEHLSYPLIAGTAGRLGVGYNATKARARIADVQMRIIGVALVVAFLGVAAGFLVSRRIVSPLGRLNSLMADYGRHDSFDRDPEALGGGHEVAALAEAFRDMVEQRRSAEALRRQSEDQWSLLLESTTEGIYGIDLDGNCTFCNPACVEKLGYRAPADLIGRDMHALIHQMRPDGMGCSVHRCRMHEACRKGEAIHSINETLWRADGSSFYAEYRSVPVRRDDMVVGAVVTFQDVTDRKETEEALRESRSLYDGLADTAPVSIFVQSTADGKISFANERGARLLGHQSGDEVVGKSLIDYLDSESRKQARERNRRVLAGLTVDPVVSGKVVRADGTVIDVERSVVACNYNGQPALQSVLYDITDLKRAEREVRKLNEDLEDRVARRTAELGAANQEMEAFTYSVSHDLRAPLRSVDGFSRILLTEFADALDPQAKHYLARVRAGTQRMGYLIDDLLKLSRSTRGDLKKEPIDLSALAGEVSAKLLDDGAERKAEVRIEPGLQAEADRRFVHVVMENLLGNAWKYTGKKPRARIEFGLVEAGGRPAFFVRDNGAGFDMAYADKLFTPFQRLHSMEEFEGNGIGLATVQRIVSRHGGKVWAEGAVEQGATFYFTLAPEEAAE